MNIAHVLLEQARRSPGRAAIVERGRTCTFADLARMASAAAAACARAGIGPGHRALVFCPMSTQLYALLVGLFRLGATAVFVDPSAGRELIARCCRRVRPAAFIGIPRAHLLRLVSPDARAIPAKIVVWRRWPPREDRHDAIEPCPPEAPALITFTSGSTAAPKAAVRSHGFLLAQQRVLADSLALAEGQVDFTTLPIFVLANLAAGVTSVLPDVDLRRPAAVDPGRLVRQIRAHRPERIAASPALLDRLARHAAARGLTFDSFDRIYTGGAPVFPRQLDACRAMAPGAAVVAVYGSTEAEPIAHVDRDSISPADREAMLNGAGLLAGPPVPSIDLRVLPDRWGTPIGPFDADAFGRECLGPAAPGEIVVAGDHVLGGYLDGAGDEETKFRVDGRIWHRTGDAGYLDADRRLWLLGRCSARVSDGHGTLYPFAVEAAATTWPWLVRSALVARDGRRMLAVQLEPSAPAHACDLIGHGLAWAHLARVVPVDEVPVDARHNAKVDYTRLASLLEDHDGARAPSRPS